MDVKNINDWQQIHDQLFFNWDENESHPAQVYYSESKNVYKSENDKTGTEYWTPKELTSEVKAKIVGMTVAETEKDIAPIDIFMANQVTKLSSGGSMAKGGEIETTKEGFNRIHRESRDEQGDSIVKAEVFFDGEWHIVALDDIQGVHTFDGKDYYEFANNFLHGEVVEKGDDYPFTFASKEAEEGAFPHRITKMRKISSGGSMATGGGVGMKWVFDETNGRVVFEDDSKNVFYTDKLTCPNSVVEEVVRLHNDGKGSREIDSYLLDEGECTTEDRELIVEDIYRATHSDAMAKGGKAGGASKRFIELAELLVQVIVETTDMDIYLYDYPEEDIPTIEKNADIKIPDSVIEKTAKALESDYKKGVIKEDENKELYYVGMIEDYGGDIEKEITRQLDATAKKHKIKKMEKGGKAGKDKTYVPKAIKKRLEELRKELRAERISQGELYELQSLAEYIDPSDVELLEPAGVPEFVEEGDKVEIVSGANTGMTGRITTIDEGAPFHISVKTEKGHILHGLNKNQLRILSSDDSMSKGGTASGNFWDYYANNGAIITGGSYFNAPQKGVGGLLIGLGLGTIGGYVYRDEIAKAKEKAKWKTMEGIDRLGKGGKAGVPKSISDVGLKLDDVTADAEHGDWTQLCDKHADVASKSKLGHLSSEGEGSGTCGVVGCNQEADYYFNFKTAKHEKGGKVYAQKKVPMTKRGKGIDGKVKALKAGWRVSKETGKPYFENRVNRSDSDRRKRV